MNELRGMAIPLGPMIEEALGRRGSLQSQCGLSNVIYHREFFRPSEVVDGDPLGIAVILTFEANGYLLWTALRKRDSEGELAWTEGIPDFLPKGREDAIDRAVAAAARVRAECQEAAARLESAS